MKNVHFSYISLLFNCSTTSSLPRNICNDEHSALSLNNSELECNVSSPRGSSTPDIPEGAGSSDDCGPRKKGELILNN